MNNKRKFCSLCPVCGSAPSYTMKNSGVSRGPIITFFCPDCGVPGKVEEYTCSEYSSEFMPQGIDAWNQRVEYIIKWLEVKDQRTRSRIDYIRGHSEKEAKENQELIEYLEKLVE